MSTRSLNQGANLPGHEEILVTEQGGEQVEGKPYLGLAEKEKKVRASRLLEPKNIFRCKS